VRRWKKFVPLALLAVIAVAVAGFAITMKPAQPPVSEKVANYTPPAPKPIVPAIFFGDSYFNGSNPVTARETFASIAAYRLGYEPIIRGHGGTGFLGDRTEEPVSPNYQGQIKAGELLTETDIVPPLVVIEGGLLDQRFDPDHITGAVINVVKSAKAAYPKAKVVLVGPADVYTPPSDGIAKVETAIAAAAEAENVPMIRIGDLMPRDKLLSVIGEDRIHPTVEGHRLLGESLAKKLTELGVPAVKD
jgi:acyl-CoA thioesterase-1